MNIANRCKSSFSPGDRSRGVSYFNSGRVQIEDATAGDLVARVRGSYEQWYVVQVDLDAPDPESSFSCTCPRFSGGCNCKHLWAAILACDQQGHTSSRNGRGAARQRGTKTAAKPSKIAPWKKQLQVLRRRLPEEIDTLEPVLAEKISSAATQHWFAICLADQVDETSLVLRLFQSTLKANGEWGKPQRRGIAATEMDQLSDATEREIFSQLRPGPENYGYESYGYHSYRSGNSVFTVPPMLQSRVFGSVAATGRFVWTLESVRHLDDAKTLAWDDGPEWSLNVELRAMPAKNRKQMLELVPRLTRANEALDLSSIVFAFDDGLVLLSDRLARLRREDAEWIRAWQSDGSIQFARQDLDPFLAEFSRLPYVPPILFDGELGIETRHGKPQPKLVVEKQEDYRRESPSLAASVWMKYGDNQTDSDSPVRAFWDASHQQWQLRDTAAERSLIEQLTCFPFQEKHSAYKKQLTIHRKWLPELVQQLSPAGWEVVAHGKQIRSAGAFNIAVTSGTDWFDLDAEADFGGVTASLPILLAAIKKKQDFIVLDDGSHGMMPEEWLQRYAQLADMGATDGESVRFTKSQALLLDVLLAEQENVSVDRDFTKYCKKLTAFDGIKPAKEPRGFCGELRHYQGDGLAWLGFLRDFEFGGCLADDMGLGKTVQVLAMLESRRSRRLKKDESRRPSIAVVPKSLIFNWIEEASRFTPKLRILNYTGLDRHAQLEQLGDGDLLITTYGTLLRDIGRLKEIDFDYAILDEAQAIKNANSQSAKACRLLAARHRLVMTGTPVENHLGDLWSLFDFLNPGLLGNSASFRSLASGNGSTGDSLAWLGQSLRPFILRRTKEQVLKDLPAKMEQTLYCEMNTKQAKLYNELREHYRAHISKKVDEKGIKRSKIHVLEALLRLRQAACDPRLIDRQQKIEGAKIELLLEQLKEVTAEGHQALVFSQFTSLLSLVRAELDQRDWTYEYLDGKTRKRGEKVKRFQEDQDCKLFLISLKAGGHGLNLTAADYVFILDPWWNPAVEAQAIDRAHRIGQTRPVMAYRIICRNTVEDKIVQLQESKRELADAIITANESLISKLSLDDLQILFG